MIYHWLAYIAISILLINCRTNVPPQTQSTALHYGENIRINQCISSYGCVEPTIAINPTNPKEVAAGAILDAFYISPDGGRSWKASTIESSHGVYGDPVLRYDNVGAIYYAHLANPPGSIPFRSEGFLDKMVVQKSTDQGANWDDGTYPVTDSLKDQDKEWITVDQNNTLYMSWTEFDKYNSTDEMDKSRILFSKKDQHATTWSEPVKINQFDGNCLDDDYTTEGAVPAVDESGNLFISWAFDHKIYFDHSFDGGKTWLKQDKIIATQNLGWNIDVDGIGRANGMPVTKYDPHSKTVYVIWTDEGVEDLDVYLTKSNDKGRTWTTPKALTFNNISGHQFFPSLELDPVNGDLHFVFYNQSSSSQALHVVHGYSFDHAESFEHTFLTEKPFDPNPGIFFGDYIDIAAYGGSIRPIWTEVNGDNTSLWTKIIEKQ